MPRKVCDQCENFQRQQNHGKWMCELKSEGSNKTENGTLVHNWIDSDQFGVKCDLECNFEEVNNPLQGIEIQCIEYKDTGDLFWQLKVIIEAKNLVSSRMIFIQTKNSELEFVNKSEIEEFVCREAITFNIVIKDCVCGKGKQGCSPRRYFETSSCFSRL